MRKLEGYFEGEWEVYDGYAGGARPQYFHIGADWLDDDMSDDDLRRYYQETCEEEMRQRIECVVKKEDEFVAWAREQLAKREAE